MTVELLSSTENPIWTCAVAASMCYDSTPSYNTVKGCIKSGHHSVLEHASFTFRITGVSRSLLAQLTRHRLASFSVQSQRYCSYAETDVSFVMPGNDKYLNGEILESAYDSLNAYNQIIAHGHSPENARAVLPNCMPTSLCMTVNLRELATICNQRLCAHAQAEIRQLFAAIKKVLLDCTKFSDEDKEIFRLLLVPKCETHPVPYCTEVKSCHKYKYLTELVK